MSTLVVPPLEEEPYPSLGEAVGEWMEANLSFGPGDLLGQPFRLDDEDRAILERAYQVYPRGHPKAGRRRFDTVVTMTRKGTKKSERLGALCAAELSDDAPVRFADWRRRGRLWEPVGRPVTSPAIWILAFAKEQAEDTAFGAMREMILKGPGADRFDVWEERILRRGGNGEARALASAPDSRDGGRTTFQAKEEAHRWVLPRHKEAHATTRANLSKRPIAEPWEMHATTAYAPGEESVAEEFHDAARAMTGETARNSRMFFFYRWADTRIEIRNEDGTWNESRLRDAVIDASGPVVAAWSDIDSIVHMQFMDAGADPEYGERVWLNRTVKRSQQAFDAQAFKELARPEYRIPKGALVVLSFDGSRGVAEGSRYTPDHSGLMATEVSTGFQQVLGHWDPLLYGGQVPRDEVNTEVDAAFTDYKVWRFYYDPPGWDSEGAAWAMKHGKDVVQEWFTWRERPMAFACSNYDQAIRTGAVSHDGHDALVAHVGHAHKRLVNARDEGAKRMWTIQKEREGSLLKIDLAVTAVIGWEARNDAIREGATAGPKQSIYATRGLLALSR